MEFALREEKANVKYMKLTLKQQFAKHIVAQHETKKLLRFSLTLTLTVTRTRTLT